MDSTTHSVCHTLSSELLKSICQKIIKLDYTSINIAFFGCEKGDNHLNAFINYMLPYIKSKYIFNKIEIYMIDMVSTKWTNKRQHLGDNIYVSGYTYDIYKQVFTNNYLDIILSYNYLNRFEVPYNIDENKYCWSLLDKIQQIKLKNIVNHNLKLFLQVRNNELRINGQILITLDSDEEIGSHPFQKTNETFSNCLNSLSRKLTNKNIFQNFFIRTCPHSINDIRNIVESTNQLNYQNSIIQKAECIFFKNKCSGFDYANTLIEVFMACNLPSLKKNITGYNCYLEKK